MNNNEGGGWKRETGKNKRKGQEFYQEKKTTNESRWWTDPCVSLSLNVLDDPSTFCFRCNCNYITPKVYRICTYIPLLYFEKKKGEPNNKEKWSDRANNKKKEKRKHTSGSTDDSTITTTLVDSASNGLWSCLVSSSSFSGSQKASGSNKREEEGSRWREMKKGGKKKKKTFDIREKRHGPFHACRRQSESIENFPFLSTFPPSSSSYSYSSSVFQASPSSLCGLHGFLASSQRRAHHPCVHWQ